MKKGYILLLVIVLIFGFLAYRSYQNTSTTAKNLAAPTTNTVTTTTTTTILPVVPCENAYGRTYNNINDTTISKECSWSGGNISLWVGSGPYNFEAFKAVGSDNLTYINQTANYSCIALYGIYKLPAQNYSITFTVGNVLSVLPKHSCNFASFELNNTAIPNNHTFYDKVYNGNFSSGTFSGWTENGTAFGRGPINITVANINGCYPESTPWSNYQATYFVTTYSCNKSTRNYGTLESSYFVADKPFLNFQAIGYASPIIYVAVVENNTPRIILHFNTYINANTSTKTFEFRNLTIPLTTVYNKPVRILIVANEIREYEYIAAGDFHLATTPNQDPNIISNITIK